MKFAIHTRAGRVVSVTCEGHQWLFRFPEGVARKGADNRWGGIQGKWEASRARIWERSSEARLDEEYMSERSGFSDAQSFWADLRRSAHFPPGL